MLLSFWTTFRKSRVYIDAQCTYGLADIGVGEVVEVAVDVDMFAR